MSTNDTSHDEHVYDGIRELDNPMPRWWVLIFGGTIIWTLLYIAYISTPGRSWHERYAAEIKEHQEFMASQPGQQAGPVTEQTLAALGADATTMAAAKAKFLATCSVCHGEHAQGVIGPNLTDSYWKHGDGTLIAIFHVVDEGVPALGMPAWGRQLSPTDVSQLAAYVGTLRGTNVTGGKPPEGNLIEAAAAK